MKTGQCIYSIVNRCNERLYVGSTINLRHRWNAHRSQLRRGLHYSSLLQSDWDAFGEDAFRLVIIERVLRQRDLLDREQYWIDKTRCCEIGYNICPVAGSPMAGRTHSAATKKKFESRKPRSGWSMDEEQKALISAAHKGKTISLETRHRMSAARKGRTHSEATKQKLSKKIRRTFALQKEKFGKSNGHRFEVGHLSGMNGKRHSEETRRKMSEAAKRRKKRLLESPSPIKN